MAILLKNKQGESKMKKLLILITMIAGFSFNAQAISTTDQGHLTYALDKAGLEHIWAGPSNLWIKNPGYDKFTLESFANKICSHTRGKGVGGYRVTFWHEFGSGEIVRVYCKA